jgi:hypothetical protein
MGCAIPGPQFWLNEGIPLKNISGRLGHSNTATTVEIYAHYLQTADKVIAGKLEEVYARLEEKRKSDKKLGQA